MDKNFAVFLFLLVPCALLAAPGAEDLESRLATVAGREKLVLLLELMAIYAEDDPRQAVVHSSEVFELLRQTPDDQLELVALNRLTAAHLRLSQFQEAGQHASRAERLARSQEDKSALALALRHLGQVHRHANAYERARAALLEAIGLYEELGDSSGRGEALKDVGITYRLVSDFPTAMRYYFRALEAFDEAKDRPGTARVLNSLGIAFTKIEQYDKAVDHLMRALAIQEELGNERSVTMILNNLGFAYLRLERPQEALHQYYRAVEIKERLGDERGLSFSLNGIGRSHFQMGEYDLAMEHINASFSLKKKFGDKKGMAALLLEKSRISIAQGRSEPAIDLLQRALAMATEVNARGFMRDAHLFLSRRYASMGRYREALESFKKYKEIEDEFFNEKNSSIIAEMQTRYESEQKAKEIEMLRQQQAIDALELSRQQTTSRNLVGGLLLIFLVVLLALNGYRSRARAARQRGRQEERERYIAELEAKNAEVEAKNAEMERFTYTVSHDLRTPLVTIRGFLGFLEKDAAEGDIGRMARDMASIDDAAEKMGQLLDELLDLSRIGRVVNAPQEVSLAEVAREAVDLVEGLIADREIEIEIAPDLPTVLADHPRLREVLQNLIENAVKFMGDQPAPRIEIGWRTDETAPVFFVRDNGIGIEPKYQDRVFGLFDRLDPAQEGTGVGLALVKRIVDVHGGKIWIESEGEGKGSVFCFTLA